MSLHQYLVPPPLALAIHPAPPYKSSSADKDKDKDKVKDKKADDKVKEAKDGAKQDDKKDKDKPVDGPGDADDKEGEAPQDADKPNKGEAALDSPGSMVPEPATPATGVIGDADEPVPVLREEADKPAELKPDPKTTDKDDANDTDAKDSKDADSKDKAKAKKDQEPEAEPLPEPLRLIGPSPKLPIRTKLDLDPSKPWPPIETDPRGAYHKYAKGVYRGLKESLRIDVTKDGWMSEQWREKSERDALARLRGDDVKKAQRELEAEARRREVRKVPKEAGGVLVMLWNALVEAPNNEISTEEFWATLDWEEEGAAVHATTLSAEQKNENKSVVINGHEIEWTKEGVEEILATVGVQCAYNSDKPIGRRYTERYPGGVFAQDRAFLLLGHGHFMLRLKEWLEFKPEDSAGKFEVLVTSGHDRVFGDMVKAQRAERKKEEEAAYIKKKRAQREKEKELEKQKEEGKKGDKEDEEVKEGKKDEKKGSDTSTKKVKDGVEVGHDSKADQEKGEAAKADTGMNELKVAVAVPVQDKQVDGPKDLDAKHDRDAVLAGPGEAAAAKGDKVGGDKRENEIRDPVKDAEQIAKMMASPGDLKMEDINLALKVLEAATGDKDKEKKDKAKKEEEEIALIWTWGESCEKWRWKNYEAGVHDVGLGGWEERDWKVFADDRGVPEFERDMESAEVEEEDVHDWSC